MFKRTLLVIGMLATTSMAFADFEMASTPMIAADKVSVGDTKPVNQPVPTNNYKEKELGTNGPGYTSNFKVVPDDLQHAMSVERLSNDYEIQRYNHEFEHAMPTYERLPAPARARVLAYIHLCYLNSIMGLNKLPGTVSLLDIIVTSPLDTHLVKNREDAFVMLRGVYLMRFTQFFRTEVTDKQGDQLTLKVKNTSKFDVSNVEGNLRMVDAKNMDRVLGDQMVTLPVSLKAGEEKTITYTLDKSWAKVKGMDTGVATKFMATAVEYKGQRLSAEDVFRNGVQNFQF